MWSKMRAEAGRARTEERTLCCGRVEEEPLNPAREGREVVAGAFDRP